MRRKRMTKCLAGILSMVIIFTMAMGNITLASEGDSEKALSEEIAEEPAGTGEQEESGEPEDKKPVDSPVNEEEAEQKQEEDTEEEAKEEVSLFSLRAAKSIWDISGTKNITDSYNALLSAAESAITSASDTNIPIINWKRSADNAGVALKDMTESNPWTWSNVAGMSLGVTGDAVWDGSRLTTHNLNDNQYLGENRVSVYNNVLYDSATWTAKSSTGEYTTKHMTVHRFQGEFSLESGIAKDITSFTLKPVTDTSKYIYINDYIFVFVHPKDVALTDSNFTQYLAFWTGGAINKNASSLASFNGRFGTKATLGNASGLAQLTNGWYCESVQDNAGDIIARTYNSETGTDYVLDVVTGDNATGGGMYRLKLEKETIARHTIQFKKTDDVTGEVVSGAEFELNGAGGSGLHYSSYEADGYIKFDAVPGTYTMRETTPPEGYEQSTDTWTVVISANGAFSIKKNNQEIEKDSNQDYVIMNHWNGSGTLEFKKVKKDGTDLAGAVFGLYSDEACKALLISAESTAEGKVTFTRLTAPGTYFVKEISAPDTYVLSDKIYQVQVTRNMETHTAETVMYLAEDEERTPVTVLTNYTKGQHLVEGMEKDKTVSVGNYENRTYQIDLSASSNAHIEGTEGSAASIVLVLDRSASMNSTAMSALTTAAENFIATAKEKSPISEIAVVTYASNVDATDFVTLDGSTTPLISAIAGMTAGGGTNMGLALGKANELLSGRENTAKYVVFFTDGRPGYRTTSSGQEDRAYNSSIAWAAYNAAVSIKQYATLYAIGYGNELSQKFSWTNGATPGSTYKRYTGEEFLRDYIATSGKYSAANAENLNKIFQDIAGEASRPLDIQADSITDVIDARFQLTAESRAALVQTYGSNVAITDNEDGTTTITWTGLAALIAHKDEEGNAGWSAELVVQAKEDFMGGNAVPTNGAGSGITVQGETTDFPRPTVNVKFLTLTAEDTEETLFLGETVNPTAFADTLMKSLKVVKTDNDKIAVPTACQLSAEELGALSAGKTVVKEYVYPGTEDTVGSFTYQYVIIAGSQQEHPTSSTGQHVEDYQLSATYIPRSIADRTADGFRTPVENAGVEVTGSSDAEGHYYINVVAGQLTITKNIDKQYTDIRQINANQSFIFRIDQYAVNADGSRGVLKNTFYETINFRANETTASKTSVVITGLEKGYYTVTEETAWSAKYALTNQIDNYELNTSECEELYIGNKIAAGSKASTIPGLTGVSGPSLIREEAGTQAELYYGLEQSFNGYAAGIGAEVTFVNRLDSSWKWLSDTAAVTNKFNQ